VVPLLEPAASRAGERAVYLHEIQDPGNLGTILRTLAWFGNFRCLLSPDSVDVHNGKVVRASMGAIFHVPVEIDVPVQLLPDRFTRIAALDLKGEPVASNAFREFDCYVFGNEARGLPHEHMSTLGAKTFTIPGTGAIESLNVAATVNICLYEINRR
jgi:TrmH family RNA methyltransferase